MPELARGAQAAEASEDLGAIRGPTCTASFLAENIAGRHQALRFQAFNSICSAFRYKNNFNAPALFTRAGIRAHIHARSIHTLFLAQKFLRAVSTLCR